MWACERYPNKINRRKNTQFVLCNDERYGEARKNIYLREYVRLIRQTDEYKLLLKKLANGENLMICEVE